MEDTPMEGVGVPVPVSGAVESFSTTLTSPEDKVEALLRVTVFADLPEDQLKWFGDNAEDRRVEPGEVLFRKGDRPEWMAIYLEGEIHAYRDESAHDGFVFIARAGDPSSEVSGMLPFSRMTVLSATGRAVTKVRVLLFPVRLFPEMMQRMPLLVQRLVGIMSDRVRAVTIADQQRDKQFRPLQHPPEQDGDGVGALRSPVEQ